MITEICCFAFGFLLGALWLYGKYKTQKEIADAIKTKHAVLVTYVESLPPPEVELDEKDIPVGFLGKNFDDMNKEEFEAAFKHGQHRKRWTRGD